MTFSIISLTYISSYMLSSIGEHLLSGILLILLSLWLYMYYYRRSGGILLCPAGLFSLSWIGGSGISAFQLSNLQTDWLPETWIVIFGMAAAFLLAYEAVTGEKWQKRIPIKYDKGIGGEPESEDGLSLREESIFTAIVIFITAFLSLSAFIFEAVKLQYIPLFTEDMPHAYSYFHITGVHYFTTAFVLLPSEAAVYLMLRKKEGSPLRFCLMDAAVCFCAFLGLLLPVLLVSRFQLILSAALCIFTILIIRRESLQGLLSGRRLILSLLIAISALGLYIFLTIERAHSVEYLRSIFEMRDPGLPIWIIQPYMYVANNFDNLNCLVRDLSQHTHGLRMLYPLLVFTGIKFFHPELVSFPIYVTKEELTTLTIAYDAYYDFGILGVVIFALILGALMGLIEMRIMRRGSRCRYMLWYVTAAQPVFYLALSFFTTWYSNPSTWFYMGASAMSYVFICICMRISEKRRQHGKGL